MATKKKPGAICLVKRTGPDRALTLKQEDMVQQYMLCGLKFKSYRIAYNTNSSGRNLYLKAWREFGKPHIQKRVAELQALAVNEHLVTKKSLADELDEARDLALEVGAPAAAVSAVTTKAKLYGQLTDNVRQEVTGAAGSPLIPTEIKITVVHVGKNVDE